MEGPPYFVLQLKPFDPMARFSASILDAFSGIIGPAVPSKWRDMYYGRTLPGTIVRPAAQKQHQQRTKLTFTNRFLKPMKGLLMISFRAHGCSGTEFSSAVAYNMKHAITGSYPAFRIHYNRVLVSRGPLSAAAAASAVMDGRLLRFSWAGTATGKASAGDSAVLVVFCPDQGFCYHTLAGGNRSDGAGRLDLSQLAGATVHTWLAFIGHSGDTSQSLYTGQFTVPHGQE